jgi:hypothetical protein
MLFVRVKLPTLSRFLAGRPTTAYVVCGLCLVLALVATLLLIQATVCMDKGNQEPPEEIRAIYRSARRLIHRRGNSPDWQPAVDKARQTIEDLEAAFPSLKDYSKRKK